MTATVPPVQVLCDQCGRDAGDWPFAARCPDCAGIYMVRPPEPAPPLPASPRGMWDYRDWLPIAPETRPVTLGEGGTPLLPSRADWPFELAFKVESANPTGSQKDRPMALAITKALELGQERAVVASTGSAALACAAYSARAGIDCAILVPADTPRARLAPAAFYGAHVFAIDGPFSATAELLGRLGPERGWYRASTNRRTNTFQAAATRTIAFEIVQAMGVPDWVVVPVGGGGTLAGIWRGFTELAAAGLAARTPRLVSVQPTGLNIIGAALAAREFSEDGVAALTARHEASTMMINLRANRMSDLADVARAVRRSGGLALAVGDDEALAAKRRLAQEEGLWIESSGAACHAAIARLAADGVVARGERVVGVLTGAGWREELGAVPARIHDVPRDIATEAVERLIADTRTDPVPN